jgi:hypothetical protein
MNSVDPRHTLHNADCYINGYAPRTSWLKEIIYRGLDVNLEE